MSPLLPLPTDSSTFEPFSAPYWSPDGSQIAAGESDGGWASGFMFGHVRVRLLPADGSSDGVPLTDFIGVNTPLNFAALLLVAWSPDQRWVAVEIRAAGGVVGGSSESFVDYSIAAIDGSSTRANSDRAFVSGATSHGGRSWESSVPAAGACWPPTRAPRRPSRRAHLPRPPVRSSPDDAGRRSSYGVGSMSHRTSVMPGADPFSALGGPQGALVLHGFTGNPQSMRGLAEALAGAGFTVELPRLPGHGTSVEDMATTSWEDWASAAEAAYLDLAARCERVVVTALSMGARSRCGS